MSAPRMAAPWLAPSTAPSTTVPMNMPAPAQYHRPDEQLGEHPDSHYAVVHCRGYKAPRPHQLDHVCWSTKMRCLLQHAPS